MSPLLDRLADELGGDRLALAYVVGILIGAALVLFALATVLPASPIE